MNMLEEIEKQNLQGYSSFESEEFESDNPMDKLIKKVEKEGDIYNGIEFTQKEKRILLPIIGGKVKIAKFYLEVDKASDINDVLDQYKYASMTPSSDLIGNAKVYPHEEVLFKNIIEKIKNGLNGDREIMLKIEKMFDGILSQEVQDKNFREFSNSQVNKSGNEEQGKRQLDNNKKNKIQDKENEIKKILKQEIQDIMRVDASFLDELKENQRDKVDIFVRDVVKGILKNKKYVLEEEQQQLFMIAKDLIWIVIDDIDNA